MNAIQLQELSFAYNGRPVLDALSLSVSSGERLAVLGPNGAGKTTLLKVMGGVLHPAHGTVRISGRSLKELPRRDVARKIAAVPQTFVVPFAFTAREIVELGRTPHLSKLATFSAADRTAVDRALELTRTTSFAERTFNELSGGERQRVMIAMALAQESEILLLDEPTQQLDLARQAEILDLISELNQTRGLTVVAAIHDLNLAARYFRRLVLLHKASLVMDGSPAQVLSAELLEKVYGGPLQVFEAPGEHLPVVLPLPHSKKEGGMPLANPPKEE